MWTARERILCNKNDIEEYLKSVSYFHDYRLGNIEFSKSTNQITIEEDTRSIHNEAAHIWDFTFDSISNLQIVIDFVVSAYITEIEIKNNKIIVGLTNGYVSFSTIGLRLGIPAQ